MTVDELRHNTIKDLGFTNWYGGVKGYLDLSPEEQSRVTDAMAVYIAAHPNEFSAGTAAAANRWATSGIIGQPYADTSFSASVGTFVDEVGNQAKKVNPLSDENRGKTYTIVAIVILAYLFGPLLLSKLSRSSQ